MAASEQLVHIHFVNFDRSLALESLTQKKLSALLKRLERRANGKGRIEVQFKLDARAPLGSVKNSEVMISYSYPGLAKLFRAKKANADLRKALDLAIKALESSVRKTTEKSESGRRTLGKSKKSVKRRL